MGDLIAMESGKYQLYEIKGDRQPIAIYSNETDFRTNHLTLKKNDTLYMFSDGYSDQMGGPKGKKFMAKKFKELLLGTQDVPMDRQKEVLEKTIEDWKSGIEQIDDILIFGIRWK